MIYIHDHSDLTKSLGDSTDYDPVEMIPTNQSVAIGPNYRVPRLSRVGCVLYVLHMASSTALGGSYLYREEGNRTSCGVTGRHNRWGKDGASCASSHLIASSLGAIMQWRLWRMFACFHFVAMFVEDGRTLEMLSIRPSLALVDVMITCCPHAVPVTSSQISSNGFDIRERQRASHTTNEPGGTQVKPKIGYI